MKKIYFVFSLILLTVIAQAQKDVYLKINHKLENAAFAFNQTATNNDIEGGNQYQLTRLEYYISEISLTHDSGQITTIPNKWLLINASDTSKELLGNFNINNLQSVSFGIGVDTSVNHNDPSLLPASHPLAPKSPSMHWGWAAGYRFVALEGNTGMNFNQIFQVHAIGDTNYRVQSHNMTGTIENGDLIIELDADYNQALNNITIDGSLIKHGEDDEAATLLSNFQTDVFSQSTVGINENKKLVHFRISPNPSSQDVFIKIDQSYQNLTYSVFDLTGRELYEGRVNALASGELSIYKKGMYLLNLYENGELIGSEKLIIR